MLDINELLNQFTLGNAAILTNACLLPLYPGLIAFLAGNAEQERSRRATGWLGVLVLAGVLTMMVLIGLVLYLVQATFGALLQYVLPLIYALVILLGAVMLAGRNPFTRLATAQAPLLRNPYAAAYVYGLFFGPMTLPCTGPIITTAFLLGATEGGSIVAELVYFVAFGLGFGWPLLVLPLIALPVQRRIIGWLSRNHDALTRGAGILLVAVGIFGIITELAPNYIAEFEINLGGQMLFWAIAAVAAVATGYATHRAHAAETDETASSDGA